MKRSAAALVAFFLLLPLLASCASEKNSDDAVTTPAVSDVSTDTSAPETTETARADVKDNLPADFTLNGASIGIYCRGDSIRKNDVDGGGDESGDLIYDAVYARTRSVEERLDLTFEITDISGKWQDFGTGMQQSILSGDDSWQIVFTTGNASIQSSRDYLFQDLADTEYMEFDQPWWWKSAMEELSLDGKQIKYLVGDICLNNYLKSGAMYFNKEIYIDNYGDADEMYKLVIAREWTYDKLREIAETVYNDLNGDGIVNDGDLYGLIVDNFEYVKHMDYSADLQRFTRDENGIPVVEYDAARAEKLLTTLNSLLYETTGVTFLNESAGRSSLFTTAATFFYAGRLEQAISASFREMEADYGIIPYPMLDDEQTEYTNIIHNSSDYVTIPITCRNVDEISGVIEALCAESYRSVVETFYESALKTKYSRDSYSGQCIDIIRDTSVKNFLYEYDGVVGCGNIIANLVKTNSSQFASTYTKTVAATNKKLAALIEKYQKLEEANG